MHVDLQKTYIPDLPTRQGSRSTHGATTKQKRHRKGGGFLRGDCSLSRCFRESSSLTVVRDRPAAVRRKQCLPREPGGVLEVPVKAQQQKKKPPGWVAFSFVGVPTGIRTPVCAVKGRCPRPLDDGDCNRHFLLSCVRVTPSSSNTKPNGTRVNHSSPVPRLIARVNPTINPAMLKAKPNKTLMTPSLCIATLISWWR